MAYFMNDEEYLKKANEDWNLPITKDMFISDKIKLIKGQRGGIGWEISMLSLDIDKLELINNEMKKRFGSNE